MPSKIKTEKHLKYCAETISKKHAIEEGWLELCARLKEIRDNGMYEGRWDNFEDFLQDPEMGMDKGTASKMITIHERLIMQYDIAPEKITRVGGWTKVAELLPVVTDKESALEWLEKAGTLSKADLRKEVKEKTDPNSVACKHPNTYEITLSCCRSCGNKEVVKSTE